MDPAYIRTFQKLLLFVTTLCYFSYLIHPKMIISMLANLKHYQVLILPPFQDPLMSQLLNLMNLIILLRVVVVCYVGHSGSLQCQV